MRLVLLKFYRQTNAFCHIMQAFFSCYEVKKYFDESRADVHKVTYFNNYYDIYHYRLSNGNCNSSNSRSSGSDRSSNSRSGSDRSSNSTSGNSTSDNSSKDEIVGNIQFIKNTYYNNFTSLDVLELYSLYVPSTHRNKSIATRLIKASILDMMARHALKRPLIALHLNPKDPMMHIVFSFYVNLGFTRVAYVDEGPEDLKYGGKRVYGYGEVGGREAEGKFLAMMCCGGLKNGRGDYREMGEEIRKRLLDYQAKVEVSD